MSGEREFRFRLRESDAIELSKAIIYYIKLLVERDEIDWETYKRLRNLYYRLSKLGKRKGGPPAKIFELWLTKEEMIENIREWLKYRIMEIEEPERYEEMRKRAEAMILRLRRN